MRETDLPAFGQMLDAVCSLLSRGNYAPSAANTALWFRSLAEHDIDAVRAGFDAHVRDPQRGRFVPTPADVIAQISGFVADDGRPGAEEAWATALRGADESTSIVWSAEMAEAWGIARPVFAAGDEVGARMAFREAYERLVGDARRKREPVAWSASLGFDAEERERALSEAAARGRIAYNPQAQIEGPATPLLEMADRPSVPESARTALRQLAEKIAARADEQSYDAAEKQRTEALKARAAEMVAERSKDAA